LQLKVTFESFHDKDESSHQYDNVQLGDEAISGDDQPGCKIEQNINCFSAIDGDPPVYKFEEHI